MLLNDEIRMVAINRMSMFHFRMWRVVFAQEYVKKERCELEHPVCCTDFCYRFFSLVCFTFLSFH
jgi:hypothetical protein